MRGVEARERTASVTFGIPAVWIGPDVAAVRAAPIQVSHRSPDKRVHDHRTDSPAPRARFAHALFRLVNGGPFRHVQSPQLQQFSSTPAISAEIFNGRQLGVRFAVQGPYRHKHDENARSYYTSPVWEY